MRWFWNALVGFDMLVNTLLGPVLNRLFWGGWRSGPWGYPGETISSVLGKYWYARVIERRPVLFCVFRVLNRIQPLHCQRAVQYDVGWTPYEILKASS